MPQNSNPLMRITAALASLFIALLLVKPSLGEDSVSEDLKASAKPLLKALSLLGTPYKYGSQNADKGVDCSGFVKQVYKESANLELPRTARAMSREGEVVAKEALRPGDLVFFRTVKKAISHVGIYAGNGEFVHASSRKRKEVTVSRLDDGYWSKRFGGARRVISESRPDDAPLPDPQ
jgi:cell wall-associated NlpC family hydrolase